MAGVRAPGARHAGAERHLRRGQPGRPTATAGQRGRSGGAQGCLGPVRCGYTRAAGPCSGQPGWGAMTTIVPSLPEPPGLRRRLAQAGPRRHPAVALALLLGAAAAAMILLGWVSPGAAAADGLPSPTAPVQVATSVVGSLLGPTQPAVPSSATGATAVGTPETGALGSGATPPASTSASPSGSPPSGVATAPSSGVSTALSTVSSSSTAVLATAGQVAAAATSLAGVPAPAGRVVRQAVSALNQAASEVSPTASALPAAVSAVNQVGALVSELSGSVPAAGAVANGAIAIVSQTAATMPSVGALVPPLTSTLLPPATTTDPGAGPTPAPVAPALGPPVPGALPTSSSAEPPAAADPSGHEGSSHPVADVAPPSITLAGAELAGESPLSSGPAYAGDLSSRGAVAGAINVMATGGGATRSGLPGWPVPPPNGSRAPDPGPGSTSSGAAQTHASPNALTSLPASMAGLMGLQQESLPLSLSEETDTFPD